MDTVSADLWHVEFPVQRKLACFHSVAVALFMSAAREWLLSMAGRMERLGRLALVNSVRAFFGARTLWIFSPTLVQKAALSDEESLGSSHVKAPP